MPNVYPVTEIFGSGLLKDLGILSIPARPTWYLSDTIVPISIVNSQEPLIARFTEITEANASAGVVAGAKAAGEVLADTGQLPHGIYRFRVYTSFSDPTNANRIGIQYRDAANAVNLQQHRWYHRTSLLITQEYMEFTISVAVNERVRVQAVDATSASFEATANIYFKLVT